MALVEISELRKLYGEVVALSDINISIPSGKFFTLLGPSGCGKTTLLRTIAGFHQQSAGRITIDGSSIEHLPAHRRDVAMVFQDYAVFPHLSVRENVAFGLKQRRIPAKEITRQVEEVLEVVELGKFVDRMPHELSGGQQQRVAIARAVVHRPAIVLCDEPTGNLDAETSASILHLLRTLCNVGNTTFLIVTHDESIANQCDSILRMSDGRFIEELLQEE